MTDLTGRLAQLLRLALSTDKSGEAIAALEALRRTLRSSGRNIHYFADAVAWLHEAPPQVARFDAGEWREMVNACRRYGGDDLSPREREFLSTLARYRASPSKKQLDWLVDIFERIRGAA
jgi:hypothetical protein